jgi:heme-degrading monooxygenase HmoA
MTFVSVTRLRIRSPRYLPAFLWHTLRSFIQARRAAGNIRATTKRAPDGAFWTLTAWESEAPMRAYRNSGAHRKAMPKLLEWCDEAAVAHWEQESRELPDWREGRRRLLERGRISKVKHPSPAQAAGQVVAPDNF